MIANKLKILFGGMSVRNKCNNEDRDFSIMLNCVDLDAISKVFRLLCICINSEYYDLEVGLARSIDYLN